MMKHFLFIFSLMCVMAASARTTASSAFTSAPPDVFPLLDKNTRLDMVDYYNSGLNTQSANRMEGHSSITSLSPESLTVRISDSSSAQIAVLPAGNDTIIAVISTVATPGLDSTLKFYDTSWHSLPASKYFTAPTWDDWVTSGHDISNVTSYAPFMLASYFIDPSSGTLTLTNNLSSFLDEEIYTQLSPALYPSLTYRWTGKKFAK